MKNEGKTTSMVEDQTRKIPSITFLNAAIASMAVSAILALTGRKAAATFVGQWAPTLLILGTYNKIAKTFSPPISESERLSTGGAATSFKQSISDTLRSQPNV
jgi:hypothetical protein